MKQVIVLVLLGWVSSHSVVAENNGETQSEGASQSGRIVNGALADLTNFKHALILRYNGQYKCGASVITYSHALTAALCVVYDRNTPSRFTLHGGSSSGDIKFTVVRVAVHPLYDGGSYTPQKDYNAAILTVNQNAFKGKTNIAIIPLQTSELPIGTGCVVAGWGKTSYYNSEYSKDLRFVNMKIVPLSNCTATLFRDVTFNIMCAKGAREVNVCGDGGGALVCGKKLVGIVTESDFGCSGGNPIGAIKVASPRILIFIRAQTGI